MKTIDLTPVLKKFNHGWVAVSADYKEVIASGKSLRDVSEKIAQTKEKNVVLISASNNYRGYVT